MLPETLLCCDLDGVLADMDGPVLHQINQEFGLSLSREDLIHYQALDDLLAPHHENPRAYLEDLYASVDLLPGLPLILPSLTGLRKIRGLVRSIRVITARAVVGKPWVEPVTKAWLDQFGFPYDRLIFREDKAAYCRANSVRYIIEDSPAQALECHEHGIGVFLVDAPYNRHVEPRGGLWRVKSLLEVPELLQEDLQR